MTYSLKMLKIKLQVTSVLRSLDSRKHRKGKASQIKQGNYLYNAKYVLYYLHFFSTTNSAVSRITHIWHTNTHVVQWRCFFVFLCYFHWSVYFCKLSIYLDDHVLHWHLAFQIKAYRIMWFETWLIIISFILFLIYHATSLYFHLY